MSGTHAQFTPAASATFAGNGLPMAVTLPPPDPANTAVVLVNLGPGEMQIVAAVVPITGAVANTAGAIRLAEGQTVFLPSPLGFAGAMATIQGGGKLVFTRGAYATTWLFPAPAVAVI